MYHTLQPTCLIVLEREGIFGGTNLVVFSDDLAHPSNQFDLRAIFY